MRRIIVLPLALVALHLMGCQSSPASTGAAVIEPTSCGDVKNMHRIGDLYVSGAVSTNDIPLLADIGIKTVFNIRHDHETPNNVEGYVVNKMGMTYIHLPWNGPDELTYGKLHAMRRVLREAQRPMLFHCGSANRVGAGYLAYRVLDEGTDLDVALAEAKTFGLRTAEYERITLDYIAWQQSQ